MLVMSSACWTVAVPPSGSATVRLTTYVPTTVGVKLRVGEFVAVEAGRVYGCPSRVTDQETTSEEIRPRLSAGLSFNTPPRVKTVPSGAVGMLSASVGSTIPVIVAVGGTFRTVTV